MTYSSTSQPDILFIFLILYILLSICFHYFQHVSGFGFCLFGGFVLFLFAQALCEVKELVTQTWGFPTCSPLPSSPPPPWFGFVSNPPTVWGFLGWDAAGGWRGCLFSICSFCANASSFASQLKKRFTCWLLKKKTKKTKKKRKKGKKTI